MNFTAAIDISTFVWNKDDYERSPEYYYPLLSLLPIVIDSINKFRLPILMRSQLYNLISNDFPYPFMSRFGYSYFSTKILRLLTTTKWVVYEEISRGDLNCTPEILKNHFSEDLKMECNCQISHLFNGDFENKFITYSYFFNGYDKLILERLPVQKQIDTLRYSSSEEIINFFERNKIKFKHNSKHDKFKSGGVISPLSCYNDRSGDTTEAQNLLEAAYLVGNDLFCFDEKNNVYVQFVSSNDGTFHGFDLSDDDGNVPRVIKKIYNRNGRSF
jgi:hypothetical protein